MVFWHGIGENGSGSATDLANVAHNGPPALIRSNQWPNTRPFIVLSPQHSGSGCPAASEMQAFITYGIANYNVDPKRVYLTGLSCGAMGSAGYLATYGTAKLAASLLIAGNIQTAYNAQGCNLVTNMGLWVVHGDADETVSINGDNAAMPLLQACSPRKDVRYTVIAGANHMQSWTRTYDGSQGDVYAWMLGFSL
jgi:predicted peptidase